MRAIAVIVSIYHFLHFLVAPVSAQVNGTLEDIEGQTVLTVWGTHDERGYAHGFLLAEEAKEIFESYILDHVCGGQAWLYDSLRSFFEDHYSVEERYEREAEAVVRGIAAAGVDLFNTSLGRDIDTGDFLVANAIVDLSQSFVGLRDFRLGCSSLSSWGSSTDSDSSLAGDLIITRLMDWETHPALVRNHLLLISKPSEEDEQPWVSIAFPGLISALSAVNESGLSSFLNVGNRTNYSLGEPFFPILFTVRNGLEHHDYDGDGESSPEDIVTAIEDRNRSAATIIHVTRNQGESSSPIIIECNNERGVAVRDVSFNTTIPENHLVATNHFRLLYDPTGCYRYQSIADSLASNTHVSPSRCWSILSDAAGVPSNLHAIQYVESQHLLVLATSTANSPAYQMDPVYFDLDQLFDPVDADIDWTRGQPGQQIQLRQNYPNPFGSFTIVSFMLPHRTHCRLNVYSLSGRRIVTLHNGLLSEGSYSFRWNGRDQMDTQVGSGIYICRLCTDQGFSTVGVSYMR